MKQILLTLICLTTFVGVKASTNPKEPKLVLEVHYTNETDIAKLNALQSDPEFCCVFDIKVAKTAKESYTADTRLLNVDKCDAYPMLTYQPIAQADFLAEVY